MGVPTEATRVVFVIDRSGSMHGDRLAHTQLELRRAIQKLPDDGAFSIIFFDTDAQTMPPGRMVRANSRNKRGGIDWMYAQHAGGGTDPLRAMEVALEVMRPEAIYLMTDGEFFNPMAVIDLIDRLNPERKVVIHTIAFHSRAAEPVLKTIAARNGGTYAYVPPVTSP